MARLNRTRLLPSSMARNSALWRSRFGILEFFALSIQSRFYAYTVFVQFKHTDEVVFCVSVFLMVLRNFSHIQAHFYNDECAFVILSRETCR